MKSFSLVHWSEAGAAQDSSERWNAASGYLVIVLGIAGAGFERGSPRFTAPIEEMMAFSSTYQRELLAQRVMFVLSAGAYLWFFGNLRSVLMRAEGGTVSFDRLLGFGLQYSTGVGETHLGRIGRGRPTSQSA